MPSAAEEYRKPSGNCQGISHCLDSGHPVYKLTYADMWMFKHVKCILKAKT